ncbi:sugar ABC transporter permease, partial [Streptomyces sp. NPDC002666]
MTSAVDRRPTAASSPVTPPVVPVRTPPRRLKDRLAGAGFLAPAVLLVAALLLTPFAVTSYRSFFSDGRVSGFTWFTNYG